MNGSRRGPILSVFAFSTGFAVSGADTTATLAGAAGLTLVFVAFGVTAAFEVGGVAFLPDPRCVFFRAEVPAIFELVPAAGCLLAAAGAVAANLAVGADPDAGFAEDAAADFAPGILLLPAEVATSSCGFAFVAVLWL